MADASTSRNTVAAGILASISTCRPRKLCSLHGLCSHSPEIRRHFLPVQEVLGPALPYRCRILALRNTPSLIPPTPSSCSVPVVTETRHGSTHKQIRPRRNHSHHLEAELLSCLRRVHLHAPAVSTKKGTYTATNRPIRKFESKKGGTLSGEHKHEPAL